MTCHDCKCDATAPRKRWGATLRTIAVPVAIASVAALAFLGPDAASERHPTQIRTVTMRNACPRVVWLFYGRNAPVRPEDAVTLAGGQSSAESMLEGDMVWLLDDDRGVLDSLTVGSATTGVVIEASCRSIAEAP